MSFSATAARLCPDPQTALVPATEPASPPQPLLAPVSPPGQEREKLFLAHLPQVRFIAENLRRHLRFFIDLDDLMGYGVIGLLKAIERFDPSRGILLKTYAEHRIRGEILNGVRKMDWLSRSARQKEHLYKQYLWDSQLSSVNRCALREEATKHPQLPQRHASTELVYAGTNLEEIEKLSEQLGLRQTVGGHAESPESAYQRKESYQQVVAAVARLPARQRQVIQWYYGAGLEMKQIAQIFNVHESRISQILSVAIKRLRNILIGDKGSPKSSQRPGQKAIRSSSTASECMPTASLGGPGCWEVARREPRRKG